MTTTARSRTPRSAQNPSTRKQVVVRHHHCCVACRSALSQHILILAPGVFPSGQHWTVPSGVIQHNNWIVGAERKRDRQRSAGFLVYDEAATRVNLDANRTGDAGSPLVCGVHGVRPLLVRRSATEAMGQRLGGRL